MQPRVRRVALLVVAVGITLSIGPRSARACSCLDPAPVAEELGRAAAVFEGVVRRVASGRDALEVELEVVRRWKGPVSRSQVVLTPPDEAACGVTFTVGESYLVYAGRQDDGALLADLCSRTKLRRTADADVAALGPGEPPAGAPPAPSSGGCVMGGRLPGSWPVLVLGVAVTLAAERRRRTPAAQRRRR
jgi:hypothetical protein